MKDAHGSDSVYVRVPLSFCGQTATSSVTCDISLVHPRACIAALLDFSLLWLSGGVLEGGRSVQAIPTHFSGELRTLAESIRGSILTANPDVRWDSIIGLEEAAKLLKEAVIQPIKYPELFTGTHPSRFHQSRRVHHNMCIPENNN